MKPKVILFNAVSVDGRFDHLEVDLGVFYGLAARFAEDATLVGSETILAAPEQGPPDPPDATAAPRPAPGPDEQRGLLVCPDSRGRVRNWGWLLSQPFWRDAVVLVSRTTPADYLGYLDRMNITHLEAGEDRVDFAAALRMLGNRFGVRVLRVDSGGRLNGVLLRAGLVDEVSLLTVPMLVGGTSPRSLFVAPDLDSPAGTIRLRLTALEQLPGGLVWTRYEVERG